LETKIEAQRSGKQFEVLFEKIAFMRGFYPVRIPDGVQITRGRPIRGYLPGFRVKAPFDFILDHEELGTAFLDLKTIATKKFPAALIKPHQIRILEKLSFNHISGFLVWYRKADRIVFFRPEFAIKNTYLIMEDGLDIGDLSNMNLVKLMMSKNNSSSESKAEAQEQKPNSR